MTNKRAEAMNTADREHIRSSLFEMNMRDGEYAQAMLYADDSRQTRAALDALDDAHAAAEVAEQRLSDVEEDFERKLDGLKETVRDTVDDLLRAIE